MESIRQDAALIDTHCHLDFTEFESDLPEQIKKANAVGVRGFLLPGVKATGWDKTLSIAAGVEGAYCGLGLHPYFIDEHCDDDVLMLEKYLANYHQVVAIGEIGLDKMCPDFARQVSLFEAQLLLAKKFARPVLLHSRKAHSEILQCITRARLTCGGVIHGFSGSVELAHAYVSKGLMIGVGGVITYPSASKTRKAMATLPLESFVLETDSPSMPLYNWQDRRNSPANVSEVFDVFCTLRGESDNEIRNQLYSNSCKLIGKHHW